MRRGTRESADIVDRLDRAGDRVLRVSISPGHVKLPSVSQLLLLPPGFFRFEGNYRGEFEGHRGLSLVGAREPLLETTIVSGAKRNWTKFERQFTVSARNACDAQKLQLALVTHSATAQLLPGASWYDNLRIKRLKSAHLDE